MTLTKKQRQAIARATEGDAQFFKRNPNRSYRVRLADPAEIAEMQSLETRKPVPAGWCVYAAICQMRPKIRARVFLLGRPGDKSEMNDGDSATIFAKAAGLYGASTLH